MVGCRRELVHQNLSRSRVCYLARLGLHWLPLVRSARLVQPELPELPARQGLLVQPEQLDQPARRGLLVQLDQPARQGLLVQLEPLEPLEQSAQLDPLDLRPLASYLWRMATCPARA